VPNPVHSLPLLAYQSMDGLFRILPNFSGRNMEVVYDYGVYCHRFCDGRVLYDASFHTKLTVQDKEYKMTDSYEHTPEDLTATSSRKTSESYYLQFLKNVPEEILDEIRKEKTRGGKSVTYCESEYVSIDGWIIQILEGLGYQVTLHEPAYGRSSIEISWK
jgi:hypothetical protein